MSEVLFERINFHSSERYLFTAVGAVGVSMVTGVYAVGRNVQTLVDRGQHQQSVGLDSAVSRNCWLGIGGGVMSVVSGGAAAAAAATARAAATMPLAGQIAIKSVAVGSSVLNGLAVSNGLANIIVKALNEKEITALDVFQFTSAVLFFTHSVISTHQAMSVLSGMGQNSSGGSAGGIKALMNRISETVGLTETCRIGPGVIVGCSPTVSIIAGGTELSLLSVCRVVGRKLVEITNSLLRGLTNVYSCLLEVGGLLGRFWESWNKEIVEVVDMICRAFGVKHWSELVIGGCKSIESGHIRAMAGTVIAEKRSLVDFGSTEMPSHQGQAICDNSAIVGTGYGPNSLVDEETYTGVPYYEEVTNILAKFVDRQMCKNPADFCKYMTFICKFVRSQLQKKKNYYEKTWKMVKNFMTLEDFKKKYGISGNPDNHFLQEVFNEFRNEEQDEFTLLQLAYIKQNAGRSTQEEQHVQSFLDAEGVCFYPFYSTCGTARNGMPSEQQYREMAAELMGRRADRDSIFVSASGDTAVIQANDAADIMMVRCWPEDGRVSGIAAVLCTSSE
jgi:Ca2+-binding EF-hand superfamily protein